MSTFWCLCIFLAFINLTNTQQITDASCQLPIDPGNCGVLSVLSTPTLRYGYARNSGNCVQFTYSGCGGNTNRFTTYSQCVTACSPTAVSINQFLNLFQYVLTGQTNIV